MMLGRYKDVEHTCEGVSPLICLVTTCSVPFPKRVRKTQIFEEFKYSKEQILSLSKMTTRSQKRKAVAELVSGDFEASLAENNPTENLTASSSKNPRLELENLEEMKTTLRKEIMSDLTKILASFYASKADGEEMISLLRV